MSLFFIFYLLCLFINMYAYNLFSRFSRYKTVMHLVCDFGMIVYILIMCI